MNETQLERIRRESMRRAIMIVAYNMRPANTSVAFVREVLLQTQEYGFVSPEDVTIEVDYLIGKGLLERVEDNGPVKLWENVCLTPRGVDYREGAVPAPTGVASIIIGG